MAVFSYCLLSASIKAGAAWKIKSMRKKPVVSPVTLTGCTNDGWTLVTAVSHIYVQMCPADWTQNHGNVAEIDFFSCRSPIWEEKEC